MPGRPQVYVDMWFLINFMMDYCILWATARVCQVRPDWRLLAGSSLFGAVYSVLVLLPGLEILASIPVKLFVPIPMLFLAFWPCIREKMLRLLCYFYLVSFTLVGSVVGLYNLFNNQTFHPFMSDLPVSCFWLAAALTTAVLIGRWGIPFIKKNFLKELLQVPVEIKIQGKVLRLDGLVDTGNQLVDPLTGAPVIIVEQEVLRPFLPAGALNIYKSGGEPDFSRLSEGASGGGHRELCFRLIPFTTIGKHHGMLVGFKADEVRVLTGDRPVSKSNVVIGIYNRRLSPRGTYRALLHPDLLQTSAGT